jgi:hypothetical protein
MRGHVVQFHQERSSACSRERFNARGDGVVGCCYGLNKYSELDQQRTPTSGGVSDPRDLDPPRDNAAQLKILFPSVQESHLDAFPTRERHADWI